MRKICLNSDSAAFLLMNVNDLTSESDLSELRMPLICWFVASTVMKISRRTPPLIDWVPWSTHRDSSMIPPKRASDTATVRTPATVISRLRRSEISVSRRK